MVVATDQRILAPGVRSLVWDGDALVDWVCGGARYGLDGQKTEAAVRYAYDFDAAVSLAGSGFAVIYTRLGTKALVLHDGQVVRELNRSFYHAHVYEYPITLFRLASGRAVLAHCPDEYCCLEIEDLASGELLTRSSARKPSDIFHSRLVASPDGRFLLSAGWVWHPIDCMLLYDVGLALEDPTHLDGLGLELQAMAEESSACFFGDGRLAVALAGDIDGDEATSLQELRIYPAGGSTSPFQVLAAGRLGTIAALGQNHVLALFDHPRLLDIRTGHEVLSWPQLRTGRQTTAVLMTDPGVPAMAVDASRRRFAVADAEGITVICLES